MLTTNIIQMASLQKRQAHTRAVKPEDCMIILYNNDNDNDNDDNNNNNNNNTENKNKNKGKNNIHININNNNVLRFKINPIIIIDMDKI